MKTDTQFVNVLQDNIRKWEAMSKLISDRTQVEISNKVQDILRNYLIKDWQSKPHSQHQNAAERCYQDAKKMANTLLDRAGAPPSLWFLALSYVCMILIHTANASIGHAISMQVLTGSPQTLIPCCILFGMNLCTTRSKKATFLPCHMGSLNALWASQNMLDMHLLS